MNDINGFIIKMYDSDQGPLPLINIIYVGKDGCEHSGLMLLDSCSFANVISSKLVGCVEGCYEKNGKSVTMVNGSNETVPARVCEMAFAINDRVFHEVFCVVDDKIPDYSVPIIGILGNVFMRRHNLVMDFGNPSIYISGSKMDKFAESDFEFFFPMEFGLKDFRIPVVGMIQGDNEIVVAADTGAMLNVISEKTLIDNGFNYKLLQIEATLNALSGSNEVGVASVDFTLLTMQDEELDRLPFKSLFYITSHDIMRPQTETNDEGEPLPSVEAVVGSFFMAQEKWILDFGRGIIYKPKLAETK